MKHIGKILAVALLASLPLAASAATLTVVETLDATKIQHGANGFTGGVQEFGPFQPTFSGSLAPGDVFDYTINFLPGQAVTIQDLNFIWAFSYTTSPESTNVQGTGTFSFLDSTGAAFLTSNVKTDDEGVAHFGQQFDPSNFTGGLPATLTFSGVHYVGTLDAYDDPTVTTRVYGDPALYFNAGGFSVPEPATWAMMILGLAGVGVSLRRRRAAERPAFA